MWAGIRNSEWRSSETLGFIIFAVILLAKLEEWGSCRQALYDYERLWHLCLCLRLWLSSSTCCSDFLHVALTYYGCLLDCGGNCRRLLDLWSFRFYYVSIHYLMCLIWNGFILSYWLNSRKLHVSVTVCLS